MADLTLGGKSPLWIFEGCSPAGSLSSSQELTSRGFPIPRLACVTPNYLCASMFSVSSSPSASSPLIPVLSTRRGNPRLYHRAAKASPSHRNHDHRKRGHAQTSHHTIKPQPHTFRRRAGQRQPRALTHDLQPEFLRCPRSPDAGLETRRQPHRLRRSHCPPRTRFRHPPRPHRTPAPDPRAELSRRPHLPGNVALLLRGQDDRLPGTTWRQV